MRTIWASSLGWLAATASAHEGHGAPAPTHLHASDLFGLLVLALGLAWWLARRSGR